MATIVPAIWLAAQRPDFLVTQPAGITKVFLRTAIAENMATILKAKLFFFHDCCIKMKQKYLDPFMDDEEHS